MIATAPSNNAKNELKEAIGNEKIIILNTTELENKLARGTLKLNEKTILIVDEGGMEGSRRTSNLLDRAEAAGSKHVVQGDTAQIQSVEGGGAMRGIIERIGAYELGHDSVVRQKEQIHREIAKDVREGRAHEAIEKMSKLDMVKEHGNHKDAFLGAAQAYLKALDSGKNSILIATTNNEVKQLNSYVREELKVRGVIDKNGELFKTSKGIKEFARGDKIIFGEKYQFDKNNEVWNGSRGVVEKVTDKTIQVRLDSTKASVVIDTDKYNKIDHGHAGTVYKAQAASRDDTQLLAGVQNSKESMYVSVTRHIETLTVHGTKEILEREKSPETGKEKSSIFEKTIERSSAKDLSTDYLRADPPNPTLPPPGQPAKAIEANVAEVKPVEQSKNQDNAKSTPERGQAIPKEQPVSTKEQTKTKAAEQPKPTSEQRQANTQKLNEAIKTKAVAAVQKVEAIKVITHKITLEKATPSKGIGMDI